MELKKLGQSLRSLVVEEVPEPKGHEAKAAPVREPVVQRPMSFPTFVPAPPIPMGSVTDPAIVQKLEAIVQQNMPPAYVKFLAQYEALKEIISDPGTLFLASMKASGCTLEQLTQAVDQILGVLDQKAKEFGQTFETNKGVTLGAVQQSILSTQQTIKDRMTQMDAIQKEITGLHAQEQEQTARYQVEEQRLLGIRQGFDASMADVRGRLESQKAHISQKKV